MIDFSKLRENLISFGFSESPHSHYLISKSKNLCIKANIPSNYGKFPNLPTTPVDNYFRLVNEDVILMFYQGITMDLNIKKIYGHKPFIGNSIIQKCSYCNANINNNTEPTPLHDASYYYCLDCQSIMCPLCHSETNYKIAFEHKVNMQKFSKRLNSILECTNKHEMTYIPASSIILPCTCDICKKYINLFHENHISDSLQIYSFGKNSIRWYLDREKDRDVCSQCSNDFEGQEFIKKHNLKLYNFKPVCDYLNFGSILDWIPIYVSSLTDFILYNLNVDSPYYKRLAYCHNNSGFYINTIDENIKLETDMDMMKLSAKLDRCIDYQSTIESFGVNVKDIEYRGMPCVSTYTTNNETITNDTYYSLINTSNNEDNDEDNISDILPF